MSFRPIRCLYCVSLTLIAGYLFGVPAALLVALASCDLQVEFV